jgi:hypothetical protein
MAKGPKGTVTDSSSSLSTRKGEAAGDRYDDNGVEAYDEAYEHEAAVEAYEHGGRTRGGGGSHRGAHGGGGRRGLIAVVAVVGSWRWWPVLDLLDVLDVVRVDTIDIGWDLAVTSTCSQFGSLGGTVCYGDIDSLDRIEMDTL